MSLQSITTDRSETRPTATDTYGDVSKLRSYFQTECQPTIGVEVNFPFDAISEDVVFQNITTAWHSRNRCEPRIPDAYRISNQPGRE